MSLYFPEKFDPNELVDIIYKDIKEEVKTENIVDLESYIKRKYIHKIKKESSGDFEELLMASIYEFVQSPVIGSINMINSMGKVVSVENMLEDLLQGLLVQEFDSKGYLEELYNIL